MKKILSAVLTGVMLLGMVGCSSNGAGGDSATKNVPTADLVSAVKEKVEMRMTVPINDELAETQYHLNLDDVEEYTIENGAMNSGLEAVAVVKAKDGKTEDVKASLEQVIEDKKAAAFYPGEAEAIEGAKVETEGNYVMLFILPDYDESGTDFSAQAVEIVKEALK